MKIWLIAVACSWMIAITLGVALAHNGDKAASHPPTVHATPTSTSTHHHHHHHHKEK